MNAYEIATLVIAYLVLIPWLYRTLHSLRACLVVAAVCLVPIVLSLERTSAFLSTDETWQLPQIIDLGMDPWNGGSSRTSYAVLSTFAAAARAVFPITLTQTLILVKCVHWLVGFVLFVELGRVLARHLVEERQRPLFLVAFFYVVGLLPTDVLAFKVGNYDLFALGLALLAIAYLEVALSRSVPGYALGAVVAATLGAQEKLSVSPILITAIALYGYVAVRGLKSISQIAVFLRVAFAVAVSAATCLATLGIVAALKGGAIGDININLTFDPLVFWIRPFVWTMDNAYMESRQLFLPVAVAACYVGSNVLLLADRVVTRRCWPIGRPIQVVTLILPIVVLIVGVVATYTVAGYWAPYRSIEPGFFVPPRGFNDSVRHFGAQTYLEHLMAGSAWAYAVFVGALPTVFWIAAGALVAAAWRRRSLGRQRHFLNVVLLVCLASPLAFGLLQLPIVNRYFNIMLLVVAVIVLIRGFDLLPSLPRPVPYGVVAALGALLLAEVIPFKPLYAAFRPIWSDYGEAYNAAAIEPGRVNPWWIGWGEEAGILGPEVRRRCLADQAARGEADPVAACRQAVLNDTWTSAFSWLDADRLLSVFEHEGDLPYARYSASDYFLVNRTCFVTRCASFPVGVQPEATLDFRGYVQAWVYRGDRLRDAGFRWSWPRDPTFEHGAGEALVDRVAAIQRESGLPLFLAAPTTIQRPLHRLLTDRGVFPKLTTADVVVVRPDTEGLVVASDDAPWIGPSFLPGVREVATVPFADGPGAFRIYRVPAARDLPAGDWRDLDATWANGVHLIAGQIDRRVAPGDEIRVRLAWRTGAAQQGRTRFAVVLADAVANEVAGIKDLPYAPGQWTAGDLVLMQLAFRFEQPLPAGVYTARLSLYDIPYTGQLPATVNPPTAPPTTAVTIGETLVRPAPGRRAAAAADASPPLGGWLRLDRADLPPTARPGAALPVTFTWQADTRPERDYTLFGHLIDAQGKLVAQHDGMPQNGQMATSAWAPGEEVVDSFELPLPPDLAPGRYTLIAGAYDGQSGQRLTTPDGAARVVAGSIEIVP